MSNQTDPLAAQVHGTNPQNLVEKITRLKIYDSQYWKTECFGLTSETLLDKAVELRYFGGTYGGNNKPAPFLCLLLKMLQLQPEREIVIEYIKNEDFKYVRVLGAFYLRITGKSLEVYRYLEPLYNDKRKIIYRSHAGWVVTYMDAFIDQLLHEELVCDIALPHLIKRYKLEDLGQLKRRVSVLEDFDEDIDEVMEDNHDKNKAEEKEKKLKKTKKQIETTNNDNVEDTKDRRHQEFDKPQAPTNEATTLVNENESSQAQERRYEGRGRRDGRSASQSPDRRRRHSRSRSRGRRDDRRRRSRRSDSRSRSPRRRGGRHHRDRRSESRSRRSRHHHSRRSYSRSRSPSLRTSLPRQQDDNNNKPSSRVTEEKQIKASNKSFDKIFGKKSNTGTKTSVTASTGVEETAAAASKDTVEYWNAERAKLGLKPLKQS